MKILFITRDFSGASLCLRLLHEGNEILAYVADPSVLSDFGRAYRKD